VKLLLDENLSPAHAVRLRRLGHDAVAVIERGMGGAEDRVVRQLASDEQRVLVTIDSDFSHLPRFPVENTPGVIWLRPWPPTETVIQALLDGALLRLAAIAVQGKIVVVEPGRIRIR
jgi:predicted nuclease of predicted toxin-antitoxin system